MLGAPDSAMRKKETEKETIAGGSQEAGGGVFNPEDASSSNTSIGLCWARGGRRERV